MKDIIKEIWDIRGMVGIAIDNHDINLFNKAKDRFVQLKNEEKYLKTLATATAGKYFETDEEFDFDRESNFAMLAFELERTRRIVLGLQNYERETLQFSSALEVLWFTRGMYDAFIKLAKDKNSNKNENDKLFAAVVVNMSEIINFYEEDMFHDKTSLKERVTLRILEKEILDKYFELYHEEFVMPDEYLESIQNNNQ